MKPAADWGAWLSMAAVAGVSLVIAVRLVASAPLPEALPLEVDRVASLDAGEAAEAPGAIKPGRMAPLAPVPTRPGTAAPAPAELGSGYRVNTPDATLVLSKTLNEISGISPSRDGLSLWAVHDERATLFRIAIQDGAVLQEIELGKRGDYESVEEVGPLVYVGRSEGVLLVVDPRGAPTTRLDLTVGLGLACDLEGMGYEAKQNRLLLSCKNESKKSRRSKKAFEIYALDLETKKLKHEPVFALDEAAIERYLEAHPELKDARGKDFAPSGVAVHPTSGEIYVLSTRAKLLLVLAPDGALVRVYPLDPALHRQPEGIGFGLDGTLFISNEAHGKQAQVHSFKPPKD